MPHEPPSLPRRLAVAMLLSLAATRANAAEGEPRIVNGLPAPSDYASVGALLEGADPTSARAWCTGTLIGCSAFLTAAHCVCEGTGAQCQPPTAPDPSRYHVYLPHAGIVPVASIAVRPDFAFPVGDVAIVKLAQPVNGIRPSAIDTTAAPPDGTAGTIVGFGRSSGSTFDYGLERFGAVTTGACPPLVSPTTSVCWTFDAPLGPAGTDSNTCNGDSGGPLFVDLGAGPVVAGVTSGGTSSDCEPTDQSYDANVFPYRSWIASQVGADLGAGACGALPPIGDAATTTIDLPGTLSSSAPEGRASFDVPAGTTLLRVAMNALDDGVANFDLYVKPGEPPTPASFACARTGTGQFAVCDLPDPAAGTWHVLVERVTGGGAYQLTATRFGTSALDLELGSTTTSVAAGESLPFTLAIDNRTAADQPFSVFALVALPDGTQTLLIPATAAGVPRGARAESLFQLALPPGAPTGAWTIRAGLWQAGAGFVDTAALPFEVR